MPSQAERYLEHARDCEQYAANAKDPEAARKFREAETAWRDLAEQWAKNAGQRAALDRDMDEAPGKTSATA